MNTDTYIEEFDEEFENEDYIILDCPEIGRAHV